MEIIVSMISIVSRLDIDNQLPNKLSDALNDEQKRNTLEICCMKCLSTIKQSSI